MASVNKVILVGNVGQTPEIRMTQSNKQVATFSLATTSTWKDKSTGERKDSTEWHRIVIFNEHLIPVIQNYVRKGSKLYLEGEQKTRKWKDSNEIDRWTTEVVIPHFGGALILLDSRKDGEETQDTVQPSNEEAYEMELNDEIPF